MASNYPQAPPTYGSVPNKPHADEAGEPLLTRSAAGPSTGGGVFEQPGHDDVPDDFKYGVSVAESSMEIRLAFVRKVYSILFAQILGTVIVSGALYYSPDAVNWVQQNIWVFFVAIIGSFVNLGLLYWKRYSHPLNLGLLASFTVFEAFTVGVAVAHYETQVVLQALLVTLGVFIGLTLFTLQSKYDFSGMGPFLCASLFALIATGLVGLLFPFSKTLDLLYAIGGCLIFSGFVVYDTYLITNRLSPDDYIFGAISLYLDFLNLFLNILRVLNNVESR